MANKEDKEGTKKAAKSRKSSEPEGWVRESIRVDAKLWRQIKIQAMDKGVTISQLLNDMMQKKQ